MIEKRVLGLDLLCMHVFDMDGRSVRTHRLRLRDGL